MFIKEVLSMATNKSEWSLVVQRLTETRAEIWIGNLFPGNKLPFQAKLEMVMLGNESGVAIASQILSVNDWRRPFRRLSDRFFKLCTFENLSKNKNYKIIFSAQLENVSSPWEMLLQATFSTLPGSLPTQGEKPFTIALGSCFSNSDDDGRVAAAYAALYDSGDEKFRPDVTFLVGDQVYLDIGFASLVPFSNFIRNRAANHYAKNWQALSDIFTRGGTWMLPDDHEYWNDYPFNDVNILALKALKISSVRDTWEKVATDGVNNIQSTRMLEIINIGEDLSICLANFRSQRTTQQFMPDKEFAELLTWAKNLRCPGVLVASQMLLDAPSEGERNLPRFDKQYAQLIEALAASGNDILMLSGDVHFGRIATVKLGTKGAMLTEVVSSPMSNLKGLLNGFASGVAGNHPESFPGGVQTNAVSESLVKVSYDDAYKVSHQKGARFSAHPKDRSDEHFMTIGFNLAANGEIELTVQAWYVRNCDSVSGLPSPGFKSVFSTRLKRYSATRH